MKVLVSCSGGADSVALFHWARMQTQWDWDVQLCHLNYGLRGLDSEKDDEFVTKISKDYSCPLHTKRVEINTDKNIQKQARNLRITYFQELHLKYNFDLFFLGQHMDDQIETSLLHLFRGAGFQGLGGMSYLKEYQNMIFIRPFLYVKKTEILEWLYENNWSYRTDKTNFDAKYKRNSIRNNLLPEIQKVFPDSKNAMSHAFDLIQHAHFYFQHQSEQNFYKLIKWYRPDVICFSIKRLKRLPFIIFTELMRYSWSRLTKAKKNLSHTELMNLFNQINYSDLHTLSNKILLEHQSYYIEIEYNTLSLYKKKKAMLKHTSFVLEKEEKKNLDFYNWILTFSKINEGQELPNSSNDWLKWQKNGMFAFSIDSIECELCLSCVFDGDTIEFEQGKHKKLSDLFTDEKIPVRMRHQSFVLKQDTKVIAIIVPPPFRMIRVAKPFYVKSDENYSFYCDINKKLT
jgi:tRNA(Ile)-lysidine synthase